MIMDEIVFPTDNISLVNWYIEHNKQQRSFIEKCDIFSSKNSSFNTYNKGPDRAIKDIF